MLKKYINPSIEIFKQDSKDVIVTSLMSDEENFINGEEFFK